MAATEQPEERSIGLERLIFFSDAVFAIAITLLVIDIKVPEIPEGQAAKELVDRVRELFPNILSYVISFLVIANYWVIHHRLFSYIQRYDNRLLWRNLYFLLFIAFLPFPTAVLGRYGNTFFAVAFYAVILIATGLTLSWLWYYATRNHRLVDADLDPGIIRTQTARNLSVPVVFSLSIGVAAFNSDAGKFFWVLLLAVPFVIRRIARGTPDDD